MSKQTEQKPSNETDRVKVGKLAQQDKELKNSEAENIRGGAAISGGVYVEGDDGGASGGVLGDRR